MTPELLAARLMAPASTSALWTYDQVKALLIRALTEDADNRDGRSLPSESVVPTSERASIR